MVIKFVAIKYWGKEYCPIFLDLHLMKPDFFLNT